MSLRVHNSLSGDKEPFVPAIPGQVRMYVCGITPYDAAHVGHARSAVVFDVIRRYLVFRGFAVTMVKNYTDVEDKIIARAAQAGEAPTALAERYIKSYEQDMEALGVVAPDIAPRATQHIAEMVAWIERLLAAEFAYVADGDVYFAVRRFPAYGRLSGRAVDDLRAGARVEVGEKKRDPLDFALWKAAKPGEPAWPSPWGAGRPGWHIECSAMSAKYLGETFDIHGGGQDLIFPHHENEIAQSEAATSRPFVRYWLHNGFVNLGAEKMSKSLGNVLSIAELVRRVPMPRETVRLHFLGTHYRHPIEYSEERLAEAGEAVWRGMMLLGRASLLTAGRVPGDQLRWHELRQPVIEELLGRLRGTLLGDAAGRCYERFTAGMDDDFGTPPALGALFEYLAELQRHTEAVARGRRPAAGLLDAVGLFQGLGRVLGLLWSGTNPYEFSPEVRHAIEPVVEAREAARRRRDWPGADELRAKLEAEHGITLEDTPGGPRARWLRPPSPR